MGRKKNYKHPYKSRLEQDLHETVFEGLLYEPYSVEYSLVRNYTPDFDSPSGRFVFEVKGRFRDYYDAQRYLYIRDVFKGRGSTFIFVFQNPSRPAYPGCRKRKDGTFMSMSEWADKNGVLWCSPETIKKEWLV